MLTPTHSLYALLNHVASKNHIDMEFESLEL